MTAPCVLVALRGKYEPPLRLARRVALGVVPVLTHQSSAVAPMLLQEPLPSHVERVPAQSRVFVVTSFWKTTPFWPGGKNDGHTE